MQMMLKLLPIAVLAFCLFSPMLKAASVKHLSLQDLCDLATVIVQAKVESSEAKWNDDQSAIWTHYALDVSETLKGEFDGDPVAHGKGGVVGTMGQAVSGEPTLAIDGEYLLFLWHDELNDRYRMLGKPQGVFAITRSEGEEAQAANSFSGVRVLKVGGEVVSERAGKISMTLPALIADVRAKTGADVASEIDEGDGEADTGDASDADSQTPGEGSNAPTSPPSATPNKAESDDE